MSHTADVNKQYFDKEAATYDTRHDKALTQIIEEIRSRLDFLGVDWADDDDDSSDDGEGKGAKAPKRPVRLLDYACGTGTISRALAPYTTQCVGIDLSEGMITAYNTRAENQGLAKEEMYAYQGDLCKPEDEKPAQFEGDEFYGFDVAAVGLGFHHFDNPLLAAKRLVSRLKPGGVLVIVEFYSHGDVHDLHDHPAKHTVKHHGFSEEEMKGIFEQAGAGGRFGVADIGSITLLRPKGMGHGHGVGHGQGHGHGNGHGDWAGEKDGKGEEVEGMKRRLFIARGTKV